MQKKIYTLKRDFLDPTKILSVFLVKKFKYMANYASNTKLYLIAIIPIIIINK